MDLIERLNASIQYIEKNLDGEISYEEAARIAYCSAYHYQRMFSFMANITLGEYIRRRRLTLAALDLQKSDIKVIDVALKYGYNSPTSFTRAFIKVHGITPSEAKSEGVKLKLYPPISFKISISGGFAMNYRIEEKNGFRVVGVKENISTVDGYNFIRIPEIWDEVVHNGTCEKIRGLCNEERLGLIGVCTRFDDNSFDYYIAAQTSKDAIDGMHAYEVKKETWAVFECKGIEDMKQVWKQIYTDWFPSSGYQHSGGAEIEWYPDATNGECQSDEYMCEIWIPVVKK